MIRRFLLSALAALAVSAPARADAEAALAGRAELLALDARCGLVDAEVRAALDAGRLTARGALARAGASDAQLDRFERDVAAGADAPCDSDQAQLAAIRAREAHAAWSAMPVTAFPMYDRAWVATRRRVDAPVWLVAQDADGVRLGVIQDGDRTSLALLAPASMAPRSVRLLFRDADAAPRPITPRLAGLIVPGATDARARRAAPDALARVAWASGRAAASDATEGGDAGTAFLFPDEILKAIAALDPREALAAEIDTGGEAAATRVYFDVGDLKAALSFAAPGYSSSGGRPEG